MDRQPAGVPEPEPAPDPDGDVVAGASLGEVMAGETGGGKVGDRGVAADILGSAVESVQEVVSLGLEPATGELVDSLAGPSCEAEVEKFHPLLGTDEKGPREEAGDAEPDSPAPGASEEDGVEVAPGARLEFAALLPDS